ncbi:hypothetical protein IFU39_00265 [Paenibacillus sp. CFBP 13594]|uniref:hypothetical protein n=1 Tax=Paenibacillus sp. CFBP 13594 TaxID=2774037 RepID=UPI001783218C|nr:hypothetical protein [Paenibacillus sp. CFBP 13594]MBD8836252.1 hypothetical protein [Paenibacillus sp. CFBP 13594]
MANLNDSKILELKKQIEEKKKSVSKSKKFTPVTNCSIELDGVRINIQTLTKEQLISLLVKLNSYAASAIDLGLLEQYSISGYNIADWIGDLKSKLEFISSKDEEQKLKIMEAKLDKLLSDDKKVELELDEIANMLNN